MEQLTHILKNYRLAMKWSALELASRLSVSEQTIWAIERGERRITFGMAETLQAISGVASSSWMNPGKYYNPYGEEKSAA